MKTVVGLFDNFSVAQNAARDLENAGIPREDISVVASNTAGQYDQHLNRDTSAYTADETTPPPDITPPAPEDTAAETAKGAVAGGVVGVLAGLAAFLIPGVGPIAAAGWVTMTLVGVGVGAAVGLVGALTGAGVPHEEAHYYSEAVRRGGTLLMVRAQDDMANRVAQIMSDDGAVNIDERAAQYRQEGFVPGATATTESSQTTPPPAWPQPASTTNSMLQPQTATPAAMTYESSDYTEQEVGTHTPRNDEFDTWDTEWRSDWRSHYANQGGNYEQYEPAYRYGYDMAANPTYQGREWTTVEPQLQRDWEMRQPGTWNQFKNSVRYAWDKATGSQRGGIKTGGYHTDDGTPDQRGMMEKVADTITGDRIDDKTGKPV